MTALDTNVIIDLQEGDSEAAESAVRAIERAGKGEPLVVCGAVFAELCGRASRKPETVTVSLRAARIAVDTSMAIDVWALASTAYAAYRQRRAKSGGGQARRILADFLIGAHASRAGALVTSDADFYRRAFPELRVIDVRSS